MSAARKQAGLFLRIAQRDRRAFEKLLEGSSEDFPVAAFLAQQAVEKSFKAVLCIAATAYDHTHDLEALAQQLITAGVELPVSLEDLFRLTPYAVAFRYDDTLIPLLTPEKARDMVDRCVAWCENHLASA
jgi:HEPN domain-containing protein